MEIGSLLVILALFILVGYFVARPLLSSQASRPISASDNLSDHEISGLMAERDRILAALQELDFDHALNKIPEEDYPIQRGILLQQGAQILRRLDSVQPTAPKISAEDRLEAAVAIRRADAARAVPSALQAAASGILTAEAPAEAQAPDGDDSLEQRLANRRRARQEKSVGFCPNCGGPVHKSDRFCPKCGKTLA
jgi:hypothetical protein